MSKIAIRYTVRGNRQKGWQIWDREKDIPVRNFTGCRATRKDVQAVAKTMNAANE